MIVYLKAFQILIHVIVRQTAVEEIGSLYEGIVICSNITSFSKALI